MSFLRELHRRLFADELEEAFTAYLEPNPVVIGAAFERQPSWCNDVTTPDTEDCSDIASAAFRSALEGLQAAHGDDPTSWRWGEAHRATFPHPVIDRLPVLGPLFNFAVATDGGVETVNRGSVPWIGPDPFQHRHGPSMRVVFDLVNLDNSRFQIATGQSGNPLSQTYGSFAKRWRDGVFVKLVGDATEDEQRLTLNPR
jgi:penicillin amidase